MELTKIKYGGTEYDCRIINGYKFADIDLFYNLELDLDDDKIERSQAMYIDEQVAGYITHEQLTTLSDNEVFNLFYSEN